MKFTNEEKERFFKYVAEALMRANRLSFEEAYEIVIHSSLTTKIDVSPVFIGHCSMSQLIDMVKNEMVVA